MPRICVIQFNVSDMDRAIDFYSNVLGFEVKTRDYYPELVLLENDGPAVLLCQVQRKANIDYPSEAQTLVNIQVDDLRSTMTDMRSKGVELIHSEPQRCPAGIYAAIRDPFGNVIELIQFGRAPGS